MAHSTVVLGPLDGLARRLTDQLDAVIVAPGRELPVDVTGVVVVSDPPSPLADAATLSGKDWHRLVDDTMWRALTALQRAHSAFEQNGGRIVVVVPTVGMAGAPGLVAYTTALEGIRAMVKSAARQWASNGIAVNLVATPLRMFAEDVAAAAGHLTVAAVQDGSTLMHTVVESVKFLLRPDMKHLAGETIVADGGAVMLP